MEKLVRIIDQQPLRQLQWTAPSGEPKTLSSVELMLTDGIDVFLAEVQGADAVNMAVLDRQLIYRVQCRLSVRHWKSQQSGQTMRANSVRIIKLQAV